MEIFFEAGVVVFLSCGIPINLANTGMPVRILLMNTVVAVFSMICSTSLNKMESDYPVIVHEIRKNGGKQRCRKKTAAL